MRLRVKSILVAIGTLTCALSVGFLMQEYSDHPTTPRIAQEIQVTDITPTSSAGFIMPQGLSNNLSNMPSEPEQSPALPSTKISLESTIDPMIAEVTLPAEASAPNAACPVNLTATPAAAAMVDLVIEAPCQGSEQLTLHHSGMMFTATVQPDGMLKLSVPALSETAVFIVSFADGVGAVAQTQVTSLPFYDRVVVQWKGDVGLQLHAREFGADYGSLGHVWQARTNDIATAARGEAGFLVRVGQTDTPDALAAEIYSFPAGTTKKRGKIDLTVETEITASNCDTQAEAQTLELREGGPLRIQDLLLDIPDCTTTGDFLVLKNMLEDMTIARN